MSEIQRIYGNEGRNVLSSRKIIQDCNKTLHAFGVVYAHGGEMLPGLTNRNGHRNITAGRNRSDWEGASKTHFQKRLVDGFTRMK